jgi:signal peptidase I
MAGIPGGGSAGPLRPQEVRRSEGRYVVLIVVACLASMVCLVGGAIVVTRYPGLRPMGLRSYRIQSGSMEPTYRIGQKVFAVQGYYLSHTPRFGDIVVARKPDQSSHGFVKRIVGLPGDRIKVSNGKLWRNGQAVAEPYIKEPMVYTWPDSGEVTVPPDSVAVLGDNRNDSNDSHMWSPPCIPLGAIEATISSHQ